MIFRNPTDSLFFTASHAFFSILCNRAIDDPPKLNSLGRHNYCRAGAAQLWQITSRGHFDLQTRTIATDDWTITIGFIECILERPTSGTSSVTSLSEFASLARLRQHASGNEWRSPSNFFAGGEQIGEWLTRPWPIYARLCRSPWRHPHGRHTAATLAIERRQASHRAYQRLADGNYLRLGKQLTKAAPIFFIRQSIKGAAHALVNIDAQRRAKFLRHARDLRQLEIIRFHHDRDDRHRHTQARAAFSLFVNKFPVSVATLRVLLTFGRIVQREFHVMKTLHALIIERRDAMSIRSDCELHRLGAKKIENREKVRMHAILAGTEIN